MPDQQTTKKPNLFFGSNSLSEKITFWHIYNNFFNLFS